jgi:hypothetical protein
MILAKNQIMLLAPFENFCRSNTAWQGQGAIAEVSRTPRPSPAMVLEQMAVAFRRHMQPLSPGEGPRRSLAEARRPSSRRFSGVRSRFGFGATVFQVI